MFSLGKYRDILGKIGLYLGQIHCYCRKNTVVFKENTIVLEGVLVSYHCFAPYFHDKITIENFM